MSLDENTKIRLVLFASIICMSVSMIGILYMTLGANVVYIAEETPQAEFTGNYTEQSELTIKKHGILSKLTTTEDTVRVGLVLDVSGTYEYNGTVYTVKQKKEPFRETLNNMELV